MPSFTDFPLLSDVSKTTQEITSWWKNATERSLALTGSPRRKGDQWLRKASLILYSGEGNQGGTDISLLRINFSVEKQTNTSPNSFYAKIYNLAPETIHKVRQYKRVQMSAGYQFAQYGIIFDGTVVLYVQGKENPTDTYLEIHAGDGDTPSNYGVILQTWPKGTLPSIQCKDCIKAMGSQVGQVKLSGERPLIRSMTFAGQAKDLIRDVTNAYPSDHFIDDGCSHIIPWEGYRTGEFVELSPSTGLIGIPKVTPAGIEAMCLLNPKLRIAGLVKIDSKWLSNVPFQPGASEPFFSAGGGAGIDTSGALPGFTTKYRAAGIDRNGMYKIQLLTNFGDTRGNAWYSQMVLAALDEAKEGRAGTAFNRSVSDSPTTAAANQRYGKDNVPALDPSHPPPTFMVREG